MMVRQRSSSSVSASQESETDRPKGGKARGAANGAASKRRRASANDNDDGDDDDLHPTPQLTKIEEEHSVTTHAEEAAKTTRNLKVHRARFIDWIPDSVEACAALYRSRDDEEEEEHAANRSSIFAVGRSSGNVEVWEMMAGGAAAHQRRVVPGKKSVGLRCLAWSASTTDEERPHSRLFAGTLSGKLLEVDFRTNSLRTMGDSLGGAVWAMRERRGVLALACEDGRVRLFNVAAGEEGAVEYAKVLSGGSPSRLLSVAWAPDGKSLFGGGMDGIVRQWDVSTNRVVNQFRMLGTASSTSAGSSDNTKSRGGGSGGGPCTVWSLDVARGGGEVLAGGDSLGRVVLWDVSTATVIQSFSEGAGGDVLSVCFSRDGRSLFASGVDARLACYRRGGDGRWYYVYSHRPHTHDVRAVCVVESGVVVSGGVDAQLCWLPAGTFETARPRKELPFPQRVVCRLSESLGSGEEEEDGDDQHLMLVRHTKRVEVWLVSPEDRGRTQLIEMRFEGDDVSLRASALSPDGRFLATSDDACGLQVFRVKLGGLLVARGRAREEEEQEEEEVKLERLAVSRLPIKDGVPASLCFARTGLLVCTMQSGAVHVLDLSSSSGSGSGLLKTFGELRGRCVVDAVVSDDGQWLAVAAADDDCYDVADDDDERRRRNGREEEEENDEEEPEVDVIVYSLDALKRHVSLPRALFGGPGPLPTSAARSPRRNHHVCFRFSPQNDELVLARDDGSVWGYRVDERRLSSWSARVPHPERIFALTFNPGEADVVYAWGNSFLTALSLAPQSPPPRTTRRFRNALHVEFLRQDELFMVEAVWFHIMTRHLPDVIQTKRYGT